MPSLIPRPGKKIEVTGGTLVAHIDLDHHRQEEFEAACESLLDSGVRDLVIDLSQCDFVSSACFGLILSLGVKCVSRGKEVSLKVKPELVSVLDLIGIRAMIPTTVVHKGKVARDFELRGARLVVNHDLSAADHLAFQVWCRRLMDLVDNAPVLDLSQIDSIDSVCIGTLTEFWAGCKERNKHPLYEVSPGIYASLQKVNLDRVFQINVVKSSEKEV